MGHARSVSAPDGPRLPSQPIIRRFELRNKSYSRTNFEPATREASAAPAASSLSTNCHFLVKLMSRNRLGARRNGRGQGIESIEDRKIRSLPQFRYMLAYLSALGGLRG